MERQGSAKARGARSIRACVSMPKMLMRIGGTLVACRQPVRLRPSAPTLEGSAAWAAAGFETRRGRCALGVRLVSLPPVVTRIACSRRAARSAGAVVERCARRSEPRWCVAGCSSPFPFRARVAQWPGTALSMRFCAGSIPVACASPALLMARMRCFHRREGGSKPQQGTNAPFVYVGKDHRLSNG
jgi:hypothetical protein